MNSHVRTLGRVAIGAAGPVALTLASVAPAQAWSDTIPDSNCTLTAGDAARNQTVNGTHKIVVDGSVYCPEAVAVSVSAEIGIGPIGSYTFGDWSVSPTSTTGSASVAAFVSCHPGDWYSWTSYTDGRVYPQQPNQKYLRMANFSYSSPILCT